MTGNYDVGKAGPDQEGPPEAPAPEDPLYSDEPSEAADAVEADLQLASLARERDEDLDALRPLQADFENHNKSMLKQQTDYLERAAVALVEKLLPVLDTVDLAVAHGGGEAVEQIWTALN